MPTENKYNTGIPTTSGDRARFDPLAEARNLLGDAFPDVEVNVSVPTTVESVSVDPVSTVTDYVKENPGKSAGIFGGILAAIAGIWYAVRG